MRESARGKGGVVSSAHPLATRAGLGVLKKGGNAIDAAIATALTLGVVAPAWSGLGGGGVGLIHISRSDETVALDYREVAPQNASPEMFELDEAGEVRNNSNAIGPLAIAVPGTAMGIATMLEKYATLRLKDLCKFARDQAARGTPMSPMMSLVVRENRDDSLVKSRRFGPTGRVFLREGKPLRAGQRFLIPNLSDTLDAIVREGPQTLCQGQLAGRIAAYLEKNGAILTQEDFAKYSSKIRSPVRGTYRGFEVCGMPPPSSGGLTVIEILNIVERLDLAAMKHNSPEAVHVLAEAMKLAYADRAAYIADPDFVAVPISKLGSKEHANQLRSLMNQTLFGVDQGTSLPHDGSCTTHLSVMDKEGNVVALTESIECYFGSGILVPEVGILMNDQMHDFNPQPGQLNSIEPKKRPLSSMAPTILFKDDRPYLALGSAGGPRIISSVVQTILNIVEFGMALEPAVAASRFHCQKDKITLEEVVESSTLSTLRKLGHIVETRPRHDLFFGGVQATVFDSARETYAGTADPRRDGIALASR